MASPELLQRLRLWHLRLGVVAAPFVAMYALTGMAMNHKLGLLKALHTGKGLGAAGALLVDLGGVLLLLLAASGVLLWALARQGRAPRA